MINKENASLFSGAFFYKFNNLYYEDLFCKEWNKRRM